MDENISEQNEINNLKQQIDVLKNDLHKKELQNLELIKKNMKFETHVGFLKYKQECLKQQRIRFETMMNKLERNRNVMLDSFKHHLELYDKIHNIASTEFEKISIELAQINPLIPNDTSNLKDDVLSEYDHKETLISDLS